MYNLIRSPNKQEFLLNTRNPGHGGHGRKIACEQERERMCLRFRRDLPMGLTVDAARLTFGSHRRKRDPTRIARANRTGFVEGEETAGGVRKKDGDGDRARAAKKHARSLGDASSVLLVANGISNASCDRRFSMELLLRIQPHYVPATYFWGWADVTTP